MSEKVFLVTGGTRGIGGAVAAELAATGAVVYATSRRATRGPLPSARPGEVTGVFLDVTEERSVRDLFGAVADRHRRLDGLLNNAGVGVFKPLVETTLDEWNRVLATNLTGAFLCAREAFRAMAGSGGGRIVNVGSVADFVPLRDNGAYGCSKWGLKGLSATINEEGKTLGIRATHVSLGAVATEIWGEREGFAKADMLPLDVVAREMARVLTAPLALRIDEVKWLPSKGVL